MKKFLLLNSMLLLTLCIIAQTPVAYYPFSGNANDAIGSLNGTVSGATLTTDRFGNANSAYSFDGVDDAINFATVPMTNTDNFTLMAWVNPVLFDPANQFNKMIISLGPGSNGYNMGMGNNNGSGSGNQLGGLYNLVAWLPSGSFFSAINTWYHVAMVREGGVTKFYLNSVLAPNTFSSNPNAFTTSFQIGGQESNPTHFWNGKIDEVKIYNVALTALQVQQEYVSSNQLQKPGSGNAISFDGFDDGVEVPNSASLQFSGDFSAECWVKIPVVQNNTANNDNAIIEKWGGSNSSIGYPFVLRYIKSTHSAILARYNGATAKGVDGIAVIDDNKWHHIVGTKMGSSLLFYIDGILQGTDADFTDLSNVNNSQNLNIGTRGPIATGPNNLTGQIDEIRIWNVGMTQTQIRDRMCKKITASDALYSNLVAYYNFDESTGATTFDGTVTANNGTLANAPTRVTSGAAIGNASSHDYVNATKTTNITHTTGESFTVTSTSGSPDGIQVYRVDEQPNTLSGASGVGTNNKYFGVFQVNGTTPQYTAAYNYNGNPSVTAGIESQLRLNKRSDNAVTSWTMLTDIPNETANTITVTGQTTEYILGTAGSSLPLHLISFSGIKGNSTVLLKWKTADEVNTSHFDVEKSSNGTVFASISTVASANSTGVHEYTAEDTQPYSGVNFYRLKQVDTDGHIKYSQIVRVLFESYGKPLTVFPNPAIQFVQFDFGGRQKTVLINVYNAAGSRVMVVSSANQLPLKVNIEKLVKGKYMVQISDGETVQNGSFIKQ